MKLLDNVRMYEVDEHRILLHFGSESETHFDGCDVRGGYIPKNKTRTLTIDEQVDYLYDKCCQPHSRWKNVAELCMAFPELQEQMLCNLNHRNRDKIKSELKSSLSFPRHDMTGIKIGDRVRFKPNGDEVTVVALSAGGWFQSVKNGPFINLEDVERVRPLEAPVNKEIKVGDRMRNVETQEEVTVARLGSHGGNFLCAEYDIWRNPQGYEFVTPAKTKLIPFQADKWTPDMQVVTRKELKHVRILCVDADNGNFPVFGLIENRVRETWTIIGTLNSDMSEGNHDLMVVVEPKTKTLYGFWNESEKYGTVYQSESERDEVVEYHEKEHIYAPIKFQTEIEL